MSDEFIDFGQAVEILKIELAYPDERAKHFVRKFADKNHDNRLSIDEFRAFTKSIQETKACVSSAFAQYDKDRNGYVTIDEARSILENEPFNFPQGKVLTLLAQFDKDHNGKLDTNEFAAFYAEARATHNHMACVFDTLDVDGNGELTEDEVVTVITDYLDYKNPGMARELVKMYDANKDGKLDKKEFVHMWTSLFGC